jgi:Methyltransferase FkbM domain
VTQDRMRVIAAGVIVTVTTLAFVVKNQVKVYRGRQARAASIQQRQALFDMLQPVALTNCVLERFGETHDGGYLMCSNLLNGVQTGYSYGIAGYDQWGCDISTKFDVTVHQYDCFNKTQPACSGGTTIFHEECVSDTSETVEGRIFDTFASQFAKNGDSSNRIVLKIDVEGAEWDSLSSAPDEVLQQIDQMAVEFHWQQDEKAAWIGEEKYLHVVRRLKQVFEIGHIHFNNASCIEGLTPFPTWAYEVLFVSKRLALVDRSQKAGGLHPFDSPNNPSLADCQPRTP